MRAELSHVPQLGLYHLTLKEAGLLIAKCLWFQGKISDRKISSDATEFHDVELDAALAKHASRYTEFLTTAVQQRTLSAASVRQDIEERVVPEETYVEVFGLAGWLEFRGIYLGAVFEEEYLTSEAELTQRILYLLKVERFAQRRPQMLEDQELQGGAENLFLRHELAKMEMEISALQAPRENYHPITEKQKSAYLNIIGALLGLLLGVSPAGQPYSKFQTQQSIIDSIHANFGEAPGLSQRNLEEQFSQAKRQLHADKS